MPTPASLNPEPFRNQVFIADARDMQELPDESVHLVVTSPPYFNIKDYSKDGRQETQHGARKSGQIGDIGSFDSFIAELLLIWKECARVLAPNGKMVINTPLMPMLKADFTTHANRHIFDLNAEIQYSILRGIKEMFLLDTYIWNRTNPSKKLMFGSYPYPSNFYAQNTIEFVTVFVKEGKSRKVSPEVKDASRLTQSEWVHLTKQVWDIPIPGKGDPAYGTHSALMPEEIVERAVRLYSFAGDIVLDPFTGSGTTPRVAKRLGRDFVGYELMPSYEDIITTKVGPGVCVTPKRPKSPRSRAVIINQPPATLIDKMAKSDAFAYLDKLPDACVDLAVVDPPYNMGKGDWDTWPTDEDFLAFTEGWIDAMLPKLKPAAGIYIFNTPRNSAHILGMLEKRGCEYQNWITWDKRDGFSGTSRRFTRQQETILYFTKGGATRTQRHTFNTDDVRVPYESTDRIAAAAKTGIIKNGKRWFPHPNGRMLGDVWHVVSERHRTKKAGRIQVLDHPTVKPTEMIERLILASSNPDDVVLDFFAGSGTTPAVAKSLGRHFLACDADEAFVGGARDRIRSTSFGERLKPIALPSE